MISLKFRLKKIDETKNYLLEEIKHHDLMCKKRKKTCNKYLNYGKHLLILVSAVTGCVSVSAFASLTAVPVGITSSAGGLKICAITAGIKTLDEIVLLGKTKSDTIEALISKALIDSYINNDGFGSVNNVLRE